MTTTYTPSSLVAGQRHARRHGASGFTLIEILVVVSIIMILIGIMAAAFMNRQGPASATRITLAALKGAAVEYEVQTGEPATSGRKDPYNGSVPRNFVNNQYVEPATVHGNAVIGETTSGSADVQGFSIERFVHQLMPNPTTQKMIISLGKDALVDSDGNRFADVVDGWGNKIIYYNPADDFDSTDQQNTPNTRFLPVSRTPYFASAGEDGKWGDHRQLIRQRKNESLTAAQATLAKEAEDNVYSFDLVK